MAAILLYVTPVRHNFIANGAHPGAEAVLALGGFLPGADFIVIQIILLPVFQRGQVGHHHIGSETVEIMDKAGSRHLPEPAHKVAGAVTAYISGFLHREGPLKIFFDKNDKTVLEISHETGFDNLSNFNRLFKKQFLMTPRELRTVKKELPSTVRGC